MIATGEVQRLILALLAADDRITAADVLRVCAVLIESVPWTDDMMRVMERAHLAATHATAGEQRQSLIADAAEAVERFGDDELEDHARTMRDQGGTR